MRKDPTPQSSNDLRSILDAEWTTTVNVFRVFHGLPPSRRFHHLGLLFERLVPWLERGIRATTLRHFLILPKETAIARLFAKAARLKDLPATHEAFLLWVEGVILRDLTDPEDGRGLSGGAEGEPDPVVQARFNRLPWSDRAILYLYVVEGCSLAEVAERTMVPLRTVLRSLKRAWQEVAPGGRPVNLPHGWRIPEGDFFRRSSSGRKDP